MIVLLWFLAFAQAAVFPRGVVEVEHDGSTLGLPVQKTDVEAFVRGDLANVTVTQTFTNPLSVAVEGTYVFPLPENAAVYAMRMRVGDEVIEGTVMRRSEATATYNEAKDRGSAAALLTQERPNVFTQRVANLMPGGQIEVQLRYAHAVPRKDGAYAFHVPLVVGPRYTPDGSEAASEVEQWDVNRPPPTTIDPGRVGIRVHLDGAMPVRSLDSDSHEVDVASDGPHIRIVELAKGRTIGNRDFVLDYRLAGDTPAVGVHTWSKDGKGVVSLVVEPPTEGSATVTPREMVFLLDCSGSMGGVPLQASKRFVRQALTDMRPTDRFRIVRFSGSASELSAEALPATPDNVAAALTYLDTLRGSGGTAMTEGIRAALTPPIPEGYIRMVVFLTDGFIGNEADVIGLLEAEREDARLFAFGVGTSVNRWLIEELARVGRGVARIVQPDGDAASHATALAERLRAPVLTHVQVDWGKAPVRETTPSDPPDLFAGEALRVMGRIDEPGSWPVTVHGRVGREPVSVTSTVVVTAEDTRAAALPAIWARSRVEDAMVDYLSPFHSSGERNAIQTRVTDMGLEYGLVTRWTSFVAVSKQVSNTSGKLVSTHLPQPPIVDVPAEAYGGAQVSSTPEPAVWAAMLLLLAMLGLTAPRPQGA